jgi:hypothetical protein
MGLVAEKLKNQVLMAAQRLLENYSEKMKRAG